MARSLPRPTPSRPRRSAADAALIRLAGPAGTPPDPAVLHDLVSAGLAEAGLPGHGPCPTQAGHARLKRLAAVEAGVPPWLAQHRPVRPAQASEAGPGAAGALVDDAESPLAWLHRRKDKEGRPLIDDASFAAGERLRADIARAGVLPRVTADWSGLGSGAGGTGGPAELLDGTIAARQRLDRAIEAIGGDFAGLLLDVCGFLKWLETVEAERGWPARSAKVVLVLALRRLAVHYGYASEARGPARSRGLRTWMAAPGPGA